MWIFLLFVLLVIALLWLTYFQPQINYNKFLVNRCSKASYYPYPVWNENNPAPFFFVISANVYFSNCSNLGPLPPPTGFTATSITSNVGGRNDMYGYVFENQESVIIAFTGTFYYHQWALDLKTQLTSAENLNNSNPEIKAHQGFLAIYNGMKDQLRKINFHGKKLYLTGISLGGALASLAALDLAQYHPIVYTFGSPRVFNIKGAELVNQLVPDITRIYNSEDVVPTLPLAIGEKQNYMHVGKNRVFTLNLGSTLRNHTEAYLKYFLK